MSAVGRRALRIDDPIGATPERRDDTDAGATRTSPDGHRLRELPVAEIHPNPDQPRKRFDDASLRSLAASIGERGVLQPVIVRPRRPGGYELVAGERRWRAAQLAGQSTIPALIDEIVDGAGSLEAALIENLVREDLTVIEPSGIASDASFAGSSDAIVIGGGRSRVRGGARARRRILLQSRVF